MNNIKVTLLSIKDFKNKIFDNDIGKDIDNMYVLTDEEDGLDLRRLRYCTLDCITRYMSSGSAFLKIEVIKDDDRTEE